jgi:hypothetical protein
MQIDSDDLVAIRAGRNRQFAAWNYKIGIPLRLRFFRALSAVVWMAAGAGGPPDAQGFYGPAVASGDRGFNAPAALALRS